MKKQEPIKIHVIRLKQPSTIFFSLKSPVQIPIYDCYRPEYSEIGFETSRNGLNGTLRPSYHLGNSLFKMTFQPNDDIKKCLQSIGDVTSGWYRCPNVIQPSKNSKPYQDVKEVILDVIVTYESRELRQKLLEEI